MPSGCASFTSPPETDVRESTASAAQRSNTIGEPAGSAPARSAARCFVSGKKEEALELATGERSGEDGYARGCAGPSADADGRSCGAGHGLPRGNARGRGGEGGDGRFGTQDERDPVGVKAAARATSASERTSSTFAVTRRSSTSKPSTAGSAPLRDSRENELSVALERPARPAPSG